MKKIFLSSLLLLSFTQSNEAASAVFSFAPTVGRTVAKLHSGWRPYFVLGFKMSNGKKLIAGGAGQLQNGWVDRSANYETGLEYAPNEFMSAQIKVPASLVNSALDLYFTPMDNIGVGVELGAYPAIYGVISLYPIVSLTVTGGVELMALGTSQRTFTEKESRHLYFIQGSVGLRFLVVDGAIFGQYAFAPGNGVTALGDLNDTALSKHLLTTGIHIKF